MFTTQWASSYTGFVLTISVEDSVNSDINNKTNDQSDCG